MKLLIHSQTSTVDPIIYWACNLLSMLVKWIPKQPLSHKSMCGRSWMVSIASPRGFSFRMWISSNKHKWSLGHLVNSNEVQVNNTELTVSHLLPTHAMISPSHYLNKYWLQIIGIPVQFHRKCARYAGKKYPKYLRNFMHMSGRNELMHQWSPVTL